MVCLEAAEKGIEIVGLISRPDTSRANNKFQYVFLNGRFIRDKFISHAVREAYRALIEPGKFPIVFLFLKMSPEDFDVNVHPTKIEVRFDNANLVHSQILAVIREKLLSLDLDVPGRMPATAQPTASDYSLPQDKNSERIKQAVSDFFKEKSSSASQRRFDFQSPKHSSPRPSAFDKNRFYSDTVDLPQISPDYRHAEFIQIHDSYIICPCDDGFMIIDQHALHERIIFEDLKNKLTAETSTLESQRLLIPESFEANQQYIDIVEHNSKLLARLGIEIVPFGPNTLAVQAFPTLLGKASITEFIQNMLDLLADKQHAVSAAELLSEILNMAACKAAVKAGRKLSADEVKHLLAEKQRLKIANRCPHGRPTVITFTKDQLQKQFKRT